MTEIHFKLCNEIQLLEPVSVDQIAAESQRIIPQFVTANVTSSKLIIGVVILAIVLQALVLIITSSQRNQYIEEEIAKFRREITEFQLGLGNTQNDLAATKKALIDTQNSLTATKKELSDSKIEAKNNLAQVKQESVPLGLIYVQLPKEKPPSEIWSSMTWTDISATYEGVFFRVLGGEAAPFGEIQNENSPRLSQIESIHQFWEVGNGVGDIPVGSWSKKFFTGVGGNPKDDFTLKFLVSGGEVRPRNMAVRIWKRTG